jgi:RNA polymerase sigma-70 factor (ECF subfamily)
MNREDFNELVRSFARKLYGFAFRFLRNQEEAEDAVQEVFLKLWKMREDLISVRSVEALATTMIKNYCIDRLRTRKHAMSQDENVDIVKVIDLNTPHEVYEQKESDTILRNIINRLPGNSGTIITMKEIDGLDYEEISEITGINVNNLRVIVARARQTIRENFNKYQNERRGLKDTFGKVL